MTDDDSGVDSGSVYCFDLDSDDDGILNAVDPDNDNDGIPNTIETAATLNPNDATDALLDLDGDGWSNLDEYRLGTDINDYLKSVEIPDTFADPVTIADQVCAGGIFSKPGISSEVMSQSCRLLVYSRA